eukprot:NODE_8432_length_1496_cov_4.504018.p1 GENE.NODE_8432_length_1496_cov_4.504018~~NODE_8432_length_1496_cov_4.504018.p1  ORF type:complete len:474 (-),score=104.73 NODE_8432_length_1496_cov_4.504018:73-1347(-)
MAAAAVPVRPDGQQDNLAKTQPAFAVRQTPGAQHYFAQPGGQAGPQTSSPARARSVSRGPVVAVPLSLTSMPLSRTVGATPKGDGVGHAASTGSLRQTPLGSPHGSPHGSLSPTRAPRIVSGETASQLQRVRMMRGMVGGAPCLPGVIAPEGGGEREAQDVPGPSFVHSAKQFPTLPFSAVQMPQGGPLHQLSASLRHMDSLPGLGGGSSGGRGGGAASPGGGNTPKDTLSATWAPRNNVNSRAMSPMPSTLPATTAHSPSPKRSRNLGGPAQNISAGNLGGPYSDPLGVSLRNSTPQSQFRPLLNATGSRHSTPTVNGAPVPPPGNLLQAHPGIGSLLRGGSCSGGIRQGSPSNSSVRTATPVCHNAPQTWAVPPDCVTTPRGGSVTPRGSRGLVPSSSALRQKSPVVPASALNVLSMETFVV